MNATVLLLLLLLLMVGGLTASLYFYGLWWTVQRLANSQHPHLIYLGSLTLRFLGLTLCVMWLARSDHPLLALAAFFAGFLIVRTIMVRHVASTMAGIGAQ